MTILAERSARARGAVVRAAGRSALPRWVWPLPPNLSRSELRLDDWTQRLDGACASWGKRVWLRDR